MDWSGNCIQRCTPTHLKDNDHLVCSPHHDHVLALPIHISFRTPQGSARPGSFYKLFQCAAVDAIPTRDNLPELPSLRLKNIPISPLFSVKASINFLVSYLCLSFDDVMAHIQSISYAFRLAVVSVYLLSATRASFHSLILGLRACPLTRL
jgi:hypothetical protein